MIKFTTLVIYSAFFLFSVYRIAIGGNESDKDIILVWVGIICAVWFVALIFTGREAISKPSSQSHANFVSVLFPIQLLWFYATFNLTSTNVYGETDNFYYWAIVIVFAMDILFFLNLIKLKEIEK